MQTMDMALERYVRDKTISPDRGAREGHRQGELRQALEAGRDGPLVSVDAEERGTAGTVLRHARRSRRGTTRWVLAGVAIYLAARTFVLRAFHPIPVLLGGDQGFFWMYGERMLRGEVPYRDFFQFTPPGADIVHLVAFALFGARVWVADALIVALGTGLAAACLRIARGIMPAEQAALATALFVVLVFGQALTTTHHWWSTLAVLWAVVELEGGSSPASAARFAGAGALLGLAAFCTQSHGGAALLAFGVFAARQGRGGQGARNVALVLSGFLVTLLVASAYFVATAGIRAMTADLVSYVFRRMAAESPGRSFGLPEALTWRSLPSLMPHLLVYTAVPAGYLLAFRRRRRQTIERASGAGVAARTAAGAGHDRVDLLWLVGVCLLAEVGLSFSWVRFFAVAAPGLLLLVWAVDGGESRGDFARRAVWIGTAALAAILIRSTQRNHSLVVDLPGGRVATDPASAEKFLWLTGHDPPGGLLFAGNRPSVYLPLQLRSPLFLDAPIPTSQTTLDQGRLAAKELDASSVKYVLWSTRLEMGMHERGLEGVAALGAYLHDHFHRVQAFADGDEAWERGPP